MVDTLSPVSVSDPIGADRIAPENAPSHVDAGILGNIERAIDQGVNAVSHAVAAVAPAADLARAVLFANQAPAEADPVLSSIRSLESRVVAVEQSIQPIAGMVEAITPESGGILGRLASIEAAIENMGHFVEKNEPLLARVLSAFNIHFGGKI